MLKGQTNYLNFKFIYSDSPSGFPIMTRGSFHCGIGQYLVIGYDVICGWSKGALNVVNFTEAMLRNFTLRKMPHILPPGI